MILYGRTEGTGLGGEKSSIYGTATSALSTPGILTDTDELEPSYSTDGSKIVFVSRRDDLVAGAVVRDQDREIYIMNSDGSNQIRLTNNNLPEGQPAFSRDGTKIVYIGSQDGGGFPVYGIYTMDLDGSNKTLIADELACGGLPYNGSNRTNRRKKTPLFEELGGFDAPNYNADGSKIIYGLFGETVNQINSDGTGCQIIHFLQNPGVPAQAVYSPDGSRIAVVEVDSVYDPDTDEEVETKYVKILDGSGNFLFDVFPFRFLSTPAWSPDGTRIAYFAGDTDFGPDGIWIEGVTVGSSVQVVFSSDLGFFEGLTWGTPAPSPNFSLRIDQPHPVRGGESTQGRVILDPSIVPPEGATIDLSVTGTPGVISLPQSTVFVPGGLTEATFPIDSAPRSDNQSAEVRAELSGNVADHTVSVLKSRADLSVTEFITPPNAFADTPFDITFKVKNIGGVPTDASWTEKIVLSLDDTFSPDDPQIGSSFSAGPLAAGGEYEKTLSVNIGSAAIPSDGEYYLILVVNPNNTLLEGDLSNNRSSNQIYLSLADLIAENLVVPANSEPAELYTATWDIRNQGQAAASSTSTARIYFSSDNIAGNADDIILDTVNTGALAAGQTQSYSEFVVIPTTPVSPSGASFFYVRVDVDGQVNEGAAGGTGETNNTTFAPTQFEYRVPDLQIASISPPPEIETDTVTPLAWNVTNAGNKQSGPFWDQVFFSVDDQVGGDIVLGTFQLTGGLDGGASADRIQNISIPTDSVPASGNYYIYVRTDATFMVNEGANEDNNVTFQQVSVRKTDRPDLQVTNITAPDTAFFDQVVQIQWTVTNNGAGATNTPVWKDRLFIGPSANSTGNATFLGDSSSVSYLDTGESYIASATVRLPRGLNGSLHLLVSTDYFNGVNEENETNNLFSRPVTVNIPPLPDYIVTQVQAPETAFAGAPIEVSWEVKNQGDGSNQQNSQGVFPNWIDRVYLSQDTTFSPGDDRLIYTRSRGGELTANSVYTGNTFNDDPNVQQFVNLPNDIQGEWYAFVETDASDQVYEFTSEDNNTNYDQAQPGSPITILATPPDLVVSGQPTAPASANAGQYIDVTYIAKNQGAFATNANWYDAIYISSDQTFDPSDTFLGNTVQRNGMAPGQEDSVTLNVQLPNCIDGTYYLFAVTDFLNTQFEFDPNIDAEANNASIFIEIQITSNPPDLQVTGFTVPAITQPGQVVPVSFTVTNTGANSPNTWWGDRVSLISNSGLPIQHFGVNSRSGGLAGGASYTVNTNIALPAFMEGEYFLRVNADFNDILEECGAENNNSADSAPFTVSNNLPDLQIDNVTVPGSGQSGGQINVQWTGINANQAMGPNPGWNDRIYLSADTVFSTNDFSIGQELVQAVLPSGGTYQRQKTVTLPNVPAGTYYVLVYADRNNNITEGTSTSVFEQNNVTASAQIVVTSPGIDLQVSALTASSPTYAGRNVSITWDVTNAGTSDTPANAWTDYVFLSRDGVLDNSDTRLGFELHNGGLVSGQTYQKSRNFLLPGGLTGDYKILVHTDRNNNAIESNDANNISAPLAVNLQLPPPADLSITNITVPPTINLDNPSGISWTVMNSGPDNAIGTWRDSVYLSRDQFWDAGDYLVGQKERANEDLAIGSTYTENIGDSQLFVEEGDYYVIVRTDARNTIREANEANNVSTSVSQTSVEITQLQIGSPLNTTIADGRQKVFKFDPPSLETLVVSLMGEPGESNELFTKFDSIVSRADYDHQGTRPGEPDQENVIPESGTGTYYSLVSNDFVPQSFADAFDKTPESFKEKGKKITERLGTGDQNITVKAEVIPFSVRKVSPTTGGNEGPLTIVAEGAKFQPGATAKLVALDDSEILPEQAKNTGTKVAAIFDLKDKVPGTYDVVITNPDNSTVTLTDGFEIVEGGGHQLRSGITGPTRFSFATSSLNYTFSAINDGLNDAIKVPIILGMSGTFDYEIAPSNIQDFPGEAYPNGTIPESVLPLHIDVDGKRFVMLFVPILRSKSRADINIKIIDPSGTVKLEVGVLPPFSEILEKGWAGVLEAINSESESLIKFAPSLNAETDARICFIEIARQMLFAILGELTGSEDLIQCSAAVLRLGLGLADVVTGVGLSLLSSDGFSNRTTALGLAGLIVSHIIDVLDCFELVVPWLRYASLAFTAANFIAQLIDCVIKTQIVAQVVSSRDPNDKAGPDGYGPENFVPVNEPLLYRINFENVSEASAPAQRISVIDQLPPTLDPRTVKIKEVGFKQYRFVSPENQAFFQQRVQLGSDLNNIKADISAGLDLLNGRIFWTLTAIDPNTGERPTDPLEGLLPPNNENQDGEGYVTFTIEPTAGQPSRTELTNSATIIFDENEPILTNTTLNLLDSGVPTSSVMALPATTDNPSIGLAWNGTEEANGSGLQGYNVYASEDGGPYTLIFSNTVETSGTFEGDWGKNYRFYSIASDNAGNVELPPAMPDASITVLGGDTEADLAPRPNGSDGTVDGTDTEQVRRFAAGLDTDFTYNEFQRADSAPIAGGGNGGLTIADVVQTRRFADGLDPLAAAKGPNSQSQFSANTEQGKTLGSLPRDLRPVRVVRLGNQLLLSVELDSQGDEVGMGFTINYDPAILSNPTNAVAGADIPGANVTINTTQANIGNVGVLIDKDPTQPIAAGTRQVFRIVFDISLTAPASTFVGLTGSPVLSEVVDGLAVPLSTTFSGGNVSLLAPTATAVSVSGRVLAETGRPVRNAVVVMTDSSGERRQSRSNQFGKYIFDGVVAGEDYVFVVGARGYQTQTQFRRVVDSVTDFDFMLALESNRKRPKQKDKIPERMRADNYTLFFER